MIGTSKINNCIKRLWPIGMSLLLATACTTDGEQGAESPSVPLVFSTTVDAQTRGGALTTDNLSSAGVFAYFTNGAFDASTAQPNFMYNQKLEKSGGAWTYSPLKYWPNNENDRITFVAYAPYVDEATLGGSNPSFTGLTAVGYPVLTYTVPAKEADQTDLLAAAPLKDRYYSAVTGSSIKLDMQHALTKVTFKVKSGDKYAKKVTSLSVKAAAKGELHYKDGGFEWKNISGSCEYTPTTATVNFAATDAGKDIATFYFLPTSTVAATFSVTYEANAADGTQIHQKTITNQALPASPLWNAGSSVVYTLNLSEETVTVTTEANSSWESTGSEEKTVRFYTADELKAGDYYYSDGTTSDGGLRQSALSNDAASGGETSGMLVGNEYIYEAKSPVAGKTCIGIVFYVGEGPGDNVTNYVGTSLSRIDGYVVALKDAENNISWGPTGGGEGLVNVDPQTDTNFNGYANTKKMKELAGFSNYPAFTSAVNYSAGVSLPSNASTWYLPSIAQLRSIYSANGCSIASSSAPEKMISLNMKKCSGAQTFRAQRYWSSSPYNTNIALYMGFNGGDLYLNATKTFTDVYHVRSILTFQRVTN